MSSGENERLAGRYRVIEQLGRGGMGVVWRAFDEVLGREVAVKELRTYTDSSGPELADLTVRMQREARAAARVRHPGVIAVHDVAEHQGRPVIVMELIDGPSLDGEPGGSHTDGKQSPSGKPTDKGATRPPSKSAKPPAPSTTASGGSDSGTTGGSSATGGSSGTAGGTSTTGGSGTTTTGGGSSTGGGPDPTPAAACHAIGGGKYNCEVWRTANSYTASGTRVGTLNAGTNYFYCQLNLGRRETYGQWTNVWWAKTDDDSGNTNVLVSDVYIKGGDNDEPVPGLPVC